MDINDLPLKYQQQAYKQAALLPESKQPTRAKQTNREHKYKAQKATEDGIKFDSKLERNCYLVLRDSGLEYSLQESFQIQEGFKDEGKAIRGITYKSDFVIKHNGNIFILDSKGMLTPEFKLKRKLLLYRGHRIICVGSQKLMRDVIRCIKGGHTPKEIEDKIEAQKKERKKAKKK